MTPITDPIISIDKLAVPIISPVEEGPPDIIQGLLPKRGELVIAGETNLGKSLIALEICSALTTGTPLWGEIIPNIRAKKILYCLGEHYIQVIQRLYQKTKLPMTDQVLIIGPEQLSYDKWLVAGGKPNLQAIDKFKAWADGMDLLIFDPLSAFLSGIDVENDNIQMRLVLDMMSVIAQSNGASCLILAHMGKPMMDKFGQEHRRKSYGIRGASAIEDAATNIFYMEKASDTGSQAAQRVSGEGGMIIDLICRKYKGEAPEKFTLMRDPSTLTHTLLGNRPYVEVLKIATQQKLARVQNARPDLLFKDAIEWVAIMDGVHPDTVRRHLGIK